MSHFAPYMAKQDSTSTEEGLPGRIPEQNNLGLEYIMCDFQVNVTRIETNRYFSFYIHCWMLEQQLTRSKAKRVSKKKKPGY